MPQECDTSNSPETQAKQAKNRADNNKQEKRLLDKFNELKAVTQAFAVISDSHMLDMLSHMEKQGKKTIKENKTTKNYQIQSMLGLDKLVDLSTNHYHSIISSNKSLSTMSDSLKTFIINSNPSIKNDSIIDHTDLVKTLHNNRNDLMIDMWMTQTDQLSNLGEILTEHASTNSKLLTNLITNYKKNIPEKSEQSLEIREQQRTDQLSNLGEILTEHASTNSKLLTNLITNYKKNIPEKSEQSLEIREQQRRDKLAQREREKDRSILMGIHGLLAGLQLGGGAAGGTGGAGGGLFTTLLAFFKNKILKWGGLLLGAMRIGLSGVWKFAKGGASLMWKGISAAGSATWRVISAAGGILKTKLGNMLGSAGTFIKSKLGTAFNAVRGVVVRMGGAVMGRLGAIGARAVSMLGPAAAVAAAAVTGWQVGKWIDEKFGISDKISDWLAGPSATEIAQEKVNEANFVKKKKTREESKKLEEEAKKEGLTDKQINRFIWGKDLAEFEKLSKEQQDRIVTIAGKRQKQQLLDLQRIEKEMRFMDDDNVYFNAEQKLTMKQNKEFVKKISAGANIRGRNKNTLKDIRDKKEANRKRMEESNRMRIETETKNKAELLKTTKEEIDKAEIDRLIKEEAQKNEKDQLLTLEDKKQKEQDIVITQEMKEALVKIVDNTGEALKKETTYFIGSIPEPSITSPVKKMA